MYGQRKQQGVVVVGSLGDKITPPAKNASGLNRTAFFDRLQAPIFSSLRARLNRRTNNTRVNIVTPRAGNFEAQNVYNSGKNKGNKQIVLPQRYTE